jgi:hypothetical protein
LPSWETRFPLKILPIKLFYAENSVKNGMIMNKSYWVTWNIHPAIYFWSSLPAMMQLPGIWTDALPKID